MPGVNLAFYVVLSMDKRWNTLYPDIMSLYKRLEEMGVRPDL